MTWRFRAVFLACVLAAAVAIAGLRGQPGLSLSMWVQAEWGLRMTDAVPIDAGSPWRDGTWAVLASLPRNGTRDLYLVRARVAPNGVPISVNVPVNLTLSEWADDSDLIVAGTRVATCVRDHGSGKVVEVQVRDIAGERPEVTGTQAWPRLDRLENAALNWADTGSGAGLDLRVWRVDPPQDRVTIALGEDDEVTLDAPGARFEPIPAEPKERLPLLHFVANMGRRLQGLGPMVELLKEVYFKATVIAEAARDELTTETAEEAAVAAPEAVAEAERQVELQLARSERPWPPAPLPVLLDERREGEGLWAEVSEQRTLRNPGAPPPFYQTFIRVDPERPRKRVFAMAWDPAQVSLRFQTGTSEPIATTGLRGEGRVPRDPKLLERLVGGFNGGFQTYHGKYGVYVDRRLYVPPLPGIATVIATDDGRTGFGTWEAGRSIGPEVLDLRQNLPPVVEDGVVNPYGILKWGASQDVAGAEGALTVRSGLCHTKDGYAAYFWCEFCDAPGLGKAMIATRCDYGVHLDMNAGHSGAELYRHIAAGERGRFPAKELGEVEATGQHFHATRMVPRMAHMRFPRYLKTDYRDFFYLVLRHVMPGPGEWTVDGLAGNGAYPPAVAVGKRDKALIELDPARFSVQAVPADGDEAARGLLVPVVPANLTIGLDLPGAVVHRAAGKTLRRAMAGTVVLAVEGGRLSVVTWAAGMDERFSDVVAFPASVATPEGFVQLTGVRTRAYQVDGKGLVEGPLAGGQGASVTRLAGPAPRLLLSLKPRQAAGFRF